MAGEDVVAEEVEGIVEFQTEDKLCESCCHLGPPSGWESPVLPTPESECEAVTRGANRLPATFHLYKDAAAFSKTKWGKHLCFREKGKKEGERKLG